MSYLIKLAKRCEAATGPDRELDQCIHEIAIIGLPEETERAYPHCELYTKSLDAAMTLVPDVHDWLVRNECERGFANVSRQDSTNETTGWFEGDPRLEMETIEAQAFAQGHRYGGAATPALALCAAALRARAALKRNAFGIPDTLKGWTVSQGPDDYYYATGPNYDASYEGEEDGWVSNGEQVSARNWEDLEDEIDTYLAERAA